MTDTAPIPAQVPQARHAVAGAAIITLAIVLAATCAVLGYVLAGTRSDLAGARSGLGSQISQLRHQVTALETRLASARSGEAQAVAAIAGTHRDLITCQDLQDLGLQSYWQDSNYNLQSNPVSLPAHCINQ